MPLKKLLISFSLFLFTCFFSSAQNIQFEFYTTAEGLSSNQITDIWQDPNGLIWVTTVAGHDRFNGTLFENIPSDHLPKNLEKKKNNNTPTNSNLSINLTNGDIFFAEENKIKHTSTHHSKTHIYPLDAFFKSSIKKLFKDQTDIIWGVTDEGLLKIKHQPSFFETYLTDGDPYCGAGGNCKMRGIAEDKNGNIYFSQYNSIHVLNPSTNEITPLLPHQKDFNKPFDLVVFKNQLWTNSSKRIDLNTKSVSTILPPNKRNDFDNGNLMIDQKGNLWLGRNNDLWQYDATKDELILSEFSKKNQFGEITYLLPSQDENYFWVGTNGNGLYKISYSKGIVDSISTSNSNLTSNFVRTLLEDKNQTIWIGTPGGLFQMSKDKNSLHRYAVNDGLPNDNINSILSEGDSALWIGTDLGLSRFNKNDKSFINFFVREGLPDNEFNRISFHKAKSGRMYFGGLNGIIAFFPKDVMAAYRNFQFKSKVVLTSFSKQKSQDEPIIKQLINLEEDNPINIYHNDNNYTFEVALTDYLQNDEIKYSFKLEGKDFEFSPPTKSNTITYNNLHHGNYTLFVKAKDAKGGWNPNPLAIHFKVHPPWWQSTLAYFFYILILAALARTVYQFLKNRILLKSELELQHQEAQRFKEMNDFKTRLYANITHEFRTPLTVILGLSDQVLENAEALTPEKIRDHMGLVSSNGNNLLHLINQILDLSKLESSNIQLHLIQANIIEFTDSIIHSFQPFAAAQKIDLSFHSDAKELKMDFDKDNLLKIISNLVSNALKYTNEGGKVKVILENTNNQTLLLKVIDTGTGIPKEALPHIFDRFFQATTNELQKQIGTGIGLSLTRELVKISDGNIRVESEMGIGTQFFVELPIRNSAPESTPEISPNFIQKKVDAYTIWPQSQKADAINSSSNQDENLPTLLIIEDNRDIIIYLKTILESIYQLEVATNGKMGVEKALEIIPDIIISDVMMPEMDGFEVCDFLKNDERTSHIPIVLLTAKFETQSRLHGLERGADAYLSKPFNKHELLIRLQKLVELREKLQTRYSGLEIPTPSEEKAVQIEDAFMEKIRLVVEQRLEDPSFGVQELCQAVRLSRMQVHRKIKALTGFSTTQFIRSIRLQKAKNLLLSREMNISEVAYDVGFNDPNYFSRAFSKFFGESPSAFLEKRS